MAASIIDGKGIALRVREGLAPRVEALKSQGITPGLAVVLVGEDPASAIYVRNKERACKKLGMNGTVLRLPEETTQQELLSTVQRLNEDPAVHGILVQLPLPRHLDEREVIRAIGTRTWTASTPSTPAACSSASRALCPARPRA